LWGFSRYAVEESVEVVGYSTCGGCPEGNVEYLPVAIGTRPIPMKYLEVRRRLPLWKESGMSEFAGELLNEARASMEAYN